MDAKFITFLAVSFELVSLSSASGAHEAARVYNSSEQIEKTNYGPHAPLYPRLRTQYLFLAMLQASVRLGLELNDEAATECEWVKQ